MLIIIEGVYRDGRVELKSLPSNVAEESKVIVTFIDADVDLAAHGIDRKQKFYEITSLLLLMIGIVQR